MKRLRLSGSTVFETCSAETTVPWITSRSSSAARIAWASDSVRWGVTEAAVVMPASFICADAGRDQLGDDRLLVHLLHPGGGLVVVELADLVEEGGRVLVAGPEALEVEDAQAAQLPQLDGGGGAHHPVHGRAEERQVEAVGVDLPGDVDVLGVPGPPARDDGDVVEPVGLTPRLEDADLDLSQCARPPAFVGPVRLTNHTGMSLRLDCERRADTPTILHPTLCVLPLRLLPGTNCGGRTAASRRRTRPGGLTSAGEQRRETAAVPDPHSAGADPTGAVSRGIARPPGTPASESSAAGASPVGWKIGFNTPAIQQHFGLSGPVVGYLTDTGVSPDGATVGVSGWTAPAVEVEVALRVGQRGEVAGLAPPSSWSTSICPSTTSRRSSPATSSSVAWCSAPRSPASTLGRCG